MRAVSRVLILAVVIAPLLVGNSEATQIRYQSVEQLGSQSTAVVTGTVTNVRSYWNADRTRILTETEIQVEKSYKGAQTSSVRVLQVGGVVDGIRMTVSGALQWRTDEEVLLFLEPYIHGAYQVSGFSQGKFEIQRDGESGEPYVRRPELQAEVLGAPTANGVTITTRVDRVPLDAFVEQALGGR